MALKTYTLRFSTLDGRSGELNDETEEVPIQGDDIRKVVREANATLKNKQNLYHYVPYLPELVDSKGVTVATTSLEPPYAHRITYIAGSEVGSKEPWVFVNGN